MSGLHSVGFVAYEAAPAFEGRMLVPARSAIPLAWFAITREPVVQPESQSSPFVVGPGFDLQPWDVPPDRADHAAAIEAIKAAIECGDVYQVNHTVRLTASSTGNAESLFHRLRRAGRHSSSATYAAYLDIGRWKIVSASPELFFRYDGNRIEARPMKGTSARGYWDAQDDERAEQLQASQKDRAENVMITDLLRNDIGKIAEVGSVRVPRLFDVERHPTVLQMTSAIQATLRPGCTLVELFRALFPCGSVTGAPKLAAMQLIARLEPRARGAYCGAIGIVGPGGDCTFSVAIRTLSQDTADGKVTYGIGGGITWDSNPEDEYREAMLKAAIITRAEPDFELVETLGMVDGVCHRLRRHLSRMGASARYFGFADPIAEVQSQLGELSKQLGSGRYRVRISAAPDGVVTIQHADFIATPQDESLVVALAATPVARDDRFLYHKTTNRSIYDSRRAERPDHREVLLWNEERELTEFTIGNVVLEIDGDLLTPPRSSGLLNGTLRSELLELGVIREVHLGIHDLRRATGIWLINSLRGWVRVTMSP